MIIRKANITDTVCIANYLLLAMEDIIFEFIGQHNSETARRFLLHFVQTEDNQYSYKNCFLAEENNQVIAAINIYDGAKLKQLRAPIVQYINIHFSKNFNPEDETQAGEYYIDSFGVNPAHQGNGIGTIMLKHVINIYVRQRKQTIGLLVDEDNPNARRLYLKLGFQPVGVKTLVGKKMVHLQINPD
ncbi:GNAT family N-acetyltransferase [Gelidibacter salicanalis]|uniref:GNAT family N-acetyltransferase n=1 Tax=Gelidibacter salicanalis TaxID=291193 RepID=A0A934NI57_9FLAO|nr:GNAT family N-acetyltransferase [Gelidibacter salicanalis]MBJ7881671.1 GNAT family N-acetyltransferase [Gelidibacter salicanalis]